MKDKEVFETGVCRYCGQIHLIPETARSQISSQSAADNWATNSCDCAAGSVARNLQEQIAAAMKNISELCAEGAEAYGYSPVGEKVMSVLFSSLQVVAAGHVRKLSVTLPNAGVVSLELTPKGRIRVKRTVSRAMTLEAEPE